MLVQMFRHTTEDKIHETLEPSTSPFTSSQRNPMFHEVSLPAILLRGHGHLCPAHPRPPSPRGAARPRNRRLCRLRSAAVFCLGSHGPRQATGRTQRNEEEKNSEKILLKSRSFGNLWLHTQKSSLDLMNIVVLRMFWWHRVGWKGHVNQIGSQNALRRKLKKCSVSKKTNMCVRLGHNRIWNQSPTERYFVQSRKRPNSYMNWKNGGSFDLWDLQIMILSSSAWLYTASEWTL